MLKDFQGGGSMLCTTKYERHMESSERLVDDIQMWWNASSSSGLYHWFHCITLINEWL